MKLRAPMMRTAAKEGTDLLDIVTSCSTKPPATSP